MNKVQLNYCYLYIFLTIFTCCAQIVQPNGGSKDEVSPKFVSAKPPNKSVNFKADKIIIKFDEYIQIKAPDQIIMSPYLPDKIIETSGKTIEISFPKTKPAPNTTYTINFGNSILDNHEATTALENYSYTFSTGPILDSCKIHGIVVNAFNKKVEKGIIAGVYYKNKFTDTTIRTSYPTYFAKSNETGQFTIENLPIDTFFLFAFKDENNNLKYNINESIGFIRGPILTGQASTEIKLLLFKPSLYSQNKLIDTLSKQKGKYQFIINEPHGINIITLNHKKSFYQIKKGINNLDTITVFLPELITNTNSCRFIVQTTDTNYQVTLLTKPKSKLPEFYLQPASTNISFSDSIKLISSTPVQLITINNIIILEDTFPIKPTYFKQINNFEWQLHFPLKEKTSYTIQVKDSQVMDVFKQYNKGIKQTIQMKMYKDYGNFILKVQTKKNIPVIIQLVEDNTEEKIIKSSFCNGCSELLFENLSPSILRIKVIVDTNKNGVWDSGDLKNYTLPEPVFYGLQPITIKAYWDIEQAIDLDQLIDY